MAAPDITWYKHVSAANPVGTLIPTALTLGTVTAGAWGPCKVLTAKVATNQAEHVKFWMNDSYALLQGGGNVSLGNTTRKFEFMITVTTALAAPLFALTGASMGTTLASDYHPTKDSVGAGISIGRGASNVITVGAKSRYIALSSQPGSLAYDGTYTDFSFQIGYDFS
jgi:hypothetical protein